jgi:two-component sensor histidine kinase
MSFMAMYGACFLACPAFGKEGPAVIKPRNDSSNIRRLLARAAEYFDTEWNYTNKNKIDSALPLLTEALRISELHADIHDQHTSLIHLGQYYFRCDNLPMAEKCFKKAITLDSMNNNKALEAEAWYHFADRSPIIEGNTSDKLFRYQKSLAIYKLLNDLSRQVDIYQRMATCKLSNGQSADAKKDLTWLLQLQQAYGDKTQYKTYYYLALFEAIEGNYNIAVNYGLIALEKLKVARDMFIESQIYANLGKWYIELEQHEKGLHYLQTALLKFQDIKNPDIHERFYAYFLLRQNAQGMIKAGRAGDAIRFVRKQNAIMYPGTDYAKQFTNGALGDCYSALGMFSLAETYYLEALKQALHNGRISNSHNEYFQIARLYANWKQFGKAGEYIDKFMSLKSEATDIAKLKEIKLMQFRIDSAAGRYVSAIRYYQDYKVLNDSIFSEKKSKQLQELQIQYGTAQKEHSIQLLRNRQKLQQIELSRANFSKRLFIIGVVILLVILLLLYYGYIQKTQKNNLLQKQQAIISKKNSSLQDLVNEKEKLLADKNTLLEEKEWLLKEIHHRVKNSLQIVISLLYSQSKRLRDEEAIIAFQESQQRIHSIVLMHQKLYLSNNMQYINMDDYIRELVDHLSDAFVFAKQGISFRLQIGNVMLPLPQAIPVGLILNEAMTNAIKYAFPEGRQGIVSICMAEDDQCCRLEIADNGKGFPHDFDPYSTETLGMTLIRGLSDQLEAGFEVCENNGGGVLIRISFHPEKDKKAYEHEYVPSTGEYD